MKHSPLPPPYVWRIDEASAYLDFNYGNVAHVIRGRESQRFRTVIQFRQKRHEGPCGSITQGVYFIERWIAARGGLPGGGKVHWYDAPRPPVDYRGRYTDWAPSKALPAAVVLTPAPKPKVELPAFTPWMDGSL